MNNSILGTCWHCKKESAWSIYCPHCGKNKLDAMKYKKLNKIKKHVIYSVIIFFL
jgi:Zn finger protein HypA/HybF involved in hydrogenase expression